MTAVNQENIAQRLIPPMQEINNYCGESVSLIVWTHKGPMVVHIVNSKRVINLSAQIGSYLPIYSATGKLFASFGNDLQVDEWKKTEFQRLTPQQVENLEKEFAVIGRNHISFAEEPLAPYVSSISIPILNYRKQLLGSITIVGFKENIPKDLEIL